MRPPCWLHWAWEVRKRACAFDPRLRAPTITPLGVSAGAYGNFDVMIMYV